MPRTFWKGVISFGLVAIPVKMSTATESKTPNFHFLHKKCLTRPKQVLYCEHDDEYIGRGDTVHGYEYADEQYVVFEEADFEKVPVKSAHSIEIHGFVKASEIDTRYYAGSHYLEPEELGAKPFSLLKTVLEKTGLVGVAKVSFSRREHLCCLRPAGDIMILHTLHFHDEVLPPDEPLPAQKPSKAELDMASKLVEAMTTTFNPDDYRDEYAAALQEMVKAELEGIEIETPELPKMEIEDLMAALRESVAAASKR